MCGEKKKGKIVKERTGNKKSKKKGKHPGEYAKRRKKRWWGFELLEIFGKSIVLRIRSVSN